MRFPPPLIYSLGVAAASAAVVLGTYFLFRRKVTPAERERRRRLAVNAAGRMTDASVSDVHDHVLHFTYEVRGVSYAASQDVAGLLDLEGYEPASLLGPATVKYVPDNPANSILLCEAWSGLRLSRKPGSSGAAQGENNR
ncbi:MAG TPA: hypothetical protein DEH78_14415 [Solibacterales bacterium]|nr:hypothetical protein [Bryobacterales bacterium]